MIGKTVNGFTLQRKLGEGGMAEVWYAENEIGKAAAVKILNKSLSNNEQIVERFHNEALVMVKLEHPNIRQVYGYGYIEDCHCIVMEYLEGDDLESLLKKGQRFTEEELRKWWNQIISALNYTHSKGIVHRDIKPSNIFLDNWGNVKLLDFGIAKLKESMSMTRTGTMMGTLMYMSPEQVRDSKNIDHRTDIYSLAVTFAQLASGTAPYDCTNSDDYTIRKGIVELPFDLSAVPSAWQGFLAPYLEKDPEKRPALRPFEALPIKDEKSPSYNEKATVAAVTTSPKSTNDMPKHVAQEAHIEPSTVASESTGVPKSKTGLWISLGVVAVVAVLLILLLRPKNDDRKYVDHEFVDLGLPSGTLWATCNIGASKPEDYGNYYAWGETSEKSTYSWDTYKYANGRYDWLTKYCSRPDYGNNGFTDNLTTLQSGDDPAASWGSGWHTPSKTQWEELDNNTTQQWTTRGGKQGMLFRSKKNGQTLFLPAAGGRWDNGVLNYAGSRGYYWSSSLYTDLPIGAWYFHFDLGYYYMDYCYYRDCGHSVRAVREN